MRIHKTPLWEREEYNYDFVDGTKLTLSPGKDGVTELDIKELHRLDDREVENNIKNGRPKRTVEQKKEIKAWKYEYAQAFENRHGYAPNDTNLKEVADMTFPANWTISIDEVNDTIMDRASFLYDRKQRAKDEYQEEIEEHIALLIKDLTKREKQVYHLVVEKDLKKYEAGRCLGISGSYVSRVMKKIRAIISADEEIKKLYFSGSDFSSNPHL